MRVPIRHVAGHLVWSTHGSVWALYRLHPGPDARGRSEETVQGTYVPAAVRDEQLARITHLIRSLSGAPRLFGLCAQVDPGEIALRMIEGIEPADTAPRGGPHPWVENVDATLDLLDDQEMHRRTLWLAVPLQTESAGLQVSASLGAMWAELSPALGMRPAPVARREVTAYREQASRVEAALAGGIAFRPARPAEVVWMIQHALHRGLAEPLLAEAEASELYGGQIREGVLHSPSYADLGQVRLQEGGIDPELDDTDDLKGAGQITRSGRTAWWRLKTDSPLRRAARRVSVNESRSGSMPWTAAVLDIRDLRTWWTSRWAQICWRTPSGVLLARTTRGPRWWVLISSKTDSISHRRAYRAASSAAGKRSASRRSVTRR